MKLTRIIVVAMMFSLIGAVCHANTKPAGEAAQAAPDAKTATTKETKQLTPPPAGKGMVWVNSESKIYHKVGSKWYGKTKKGSYMSENEAIKAGFRETKAGAN